MKFKNIEYNKDGYVIDGVFYTFEQLLNILLEENKDVFIRLKDR